jgi:hypothetical protein
MLAVMIIILIVQVLVLLFLVIGVGHLGNIAGALGHIAWTFSTPVEAPDEERER